MVARVLLACTAASLICAAPLHATVLDGQILRQTGTGSFVKLETDTAFTVGADNFDDCNLYAFDEDQNIILVEPVRVDISADNPNGEDGVIPAGTEVASHYVFFDSLDGVHHGYIDFDAPILGVAALRDTMAATDYLANTQVTYIGEELRGLETGDHVWIDEEFPERLWVYWAGSSPGDYIRVFTARSAAAAMM